MRPSPGCKRPVDSNAETLEDFAKAMRGLHAQCEAFKTWFDFLNFDDYCSFSGPTLSEWCPRPDLNRRP
jgi:hypothetical protein